MKKIKINKRVLAAITSFALMISSVGATAEGLSSAEKELLASYGFNDIDNEFELDFEAFASGAAQVYTKLKNNNILFGGSEAKTKQFALDSYYIFTSDFINSDLNETLVGNVVTSHNFLQSFNEQGNFVGWNDPNGRKIMVDIVTPGLDLINDFNHKKLGEIENKKTMSPEAFVDQGLDSQLDPSEIFVGEKNDTYHLHETFIAVQNIAYEMVKGDQNKIMEAFLTAKEQITTLNAGETNINAESMSRGGYYIYQYLNGGTFMHYLSRQIRCITPKKTLDKYFSDEGETLKPKKIGENGEAVTPKFDENEKVNIKEYVKMFYEVYVFTNTTLTDEIYNALREKTLKEKEHTSFLVTNQDGIGIYNQSNVNGRRRG